MQAVKRNIYFILFILITLAPVNNNTFTGGLPIDTTQEYLYVVLLLIIAKNKLSKSNFKKSIYIIIFLILIKAVNLFIASGDIKLCYKDDLIPRTQQFSYIDINFECEPTFRSLSKNYSDSTNMVNFSYFNDDFKYLGSNNSKFNLSFMNFSKFNYHLNDTTNREWLPFELEFVLPIKNYQNYIKFSYIGELEIVIDNFKILRNKNYLFKEEVILKSLPKDSKSIKIRYKFDKQPPILHNDIAYEKNESYPYAYLEIYESSNGSNWNLYNTTSNYEARLIFFLQFILLVFLFDKKNVKQINHYCKQYFYELLLLMFLFSELVFGYFLNRNFIFGVFNFYTFFVLILFTLLFSYSSINNIFSLLNIALLNLILVDKEWRILDTYIRPGGSDSLTYESLSRIVLLSEPLRGGEAVYHYSPGARYVNLLLHLLFGDRFKLIWITVLTVTTFLIIRYLVYSNSVNKIFKYIAVITILIYLTSNGVQRVFYYGMSESYALLFFALLLNIQKNHKVLLNLVAGIVVLIRPVFLLGVISYLIYIKLNFKELKKFYFLILLPLVHNLFFGSSFVIFTKSWDSALDILEERQEFFKHIMRNISYIIMAPYNEDVITRVGSLIPFFTFTFFLIYIFILLNKLTHIELSYLDTTPVLLSTPLLFYDIYYFYPRFLIVTHVFVFIVVLKNIKIMSEKLLLKKNNTFISLLKV